MMLICINCDNQEHHTCTCIFVIGDVGLMEIHYFAKHWCKIFLMHVLFSGRSKWNTTTDVPCLRPPVSSLSCSIRRPSPPSPAPPPHTPPYASTPRGASYSPSPPVQQSAPHTYTSHTWVQSLSIFHTFKYNIFMYFAILMLNLHL